MKNYIFIILIMFLGCLERRETISYEKGIVVEKQYFPNTEQVVSGTGISSKGNVVITTHTVGHKEKFIVIFKCEHGVIFSINKSDLYGKLNKGDTVKIQYYEMIDSDGNVKDFDFVDANKI